MHSINTKIKTENEQNLKFTFSHLSLSLNPPEVSSAAEPPCVAAYIVVGAPFGHENLRINAPSLPRSRSGMNLAKNRTQMLQMNELSNYFSDMYFNSLRSFFSPERKGKYGSKTKKEQSNEND
ncbi:putative DNA topoisomerase I (ISS) protein [Corchorus olitorius]|uniref:DNA topoisomerase I (ISS) protein n=1 Tax=Corchorus olitorius TaxID=93759 RepID=A0A1R3HFU8_9ROSI|nr:putative DNA topoisomerase I (ISS) protein [Corchorus olitorius]